MTNKEAIEISKIALKEAEQALKTGPLMNYINEREDLHNEIKPILEKAKKSIEANRRLIEIAERFETIQENPKATMVMDENRFSITVREENAVISLIEENQSLREKLKCFEGAVELTDGVGYIKKHEDVFLQAFTSNYKLYAIPKEQK